MNISIFAAFILIVPFVMGHRFSSEIRPRIRETISHFFAGVRHPIVNKTALTQAKDLIYEELVDLGFNVTVERFTSSVSTDSQYDQDKVYGHNVIGLLKGKFWGTLKDKLVVIGAHYDTDSHIQRDYSGSGPVALLEIARKISALHKYGDCMLDHSIIVVAFDLQTRIHTYPDDKTGSKAFVQGYLTDILARGSRYGFGIMLGSVVSYNTTNGTQHYPGNEQDFKKSFPAAYHNIQYVHASAGDFLAVVSHQDIEEDLVSRFTAEWEQRRPGRVVNLNIGERAGGSSTEASRYFMQQDHRDFWDYNYLGDKYNLTTIYLSDTDYYRGAPTICPPNRLRRDADQVATSSEKPMLIATNKPTLIETNKPILIATDKPVLNATDKPILIATDKPIETNISILIDTEEKRQLKYCNVDLELTDEKIEFMLHTIDTVFNLVSDHSCKDDDNSSAGLTAAISLCLIPILVATILT